MSEERQETIDDIVKEIRGNAEHNHALVEVSKYLTEIADRIEAAANNQFREATKMIPHEEDVSKMETTTPTSEKSSAVGNAAAMRKALESVRNWCLNRLVNSSYQVTIEGLLSVVNAALSAPPRNCDVGTPEEQSARFDAHCRKHMGCLTCPLREKDGGVPKHCEFAWAQMPYEVGGEE